MQERQLRLVINAAIIIFIIILYSLFAAPVIQLLKCPFYTITGFYCPGCGSQRAIAALLHGETGKAIHYNVLLVASLPFLLYSGVVAVVNTLRKKPVTQYFFYSKTFAFITLGVILAFWILRNINFYPLNLLAPHE